MSDRGKGIQDPELYRRLSEPHASLDAATNVLDSFAEAVRVLREQYGIPDLVMVMRLNVRAEDGTEEQRIQIQHHGDSGQAETLLAWALGKERAARERQLEVLAGVCR